MELQTYLNNMMDPAGLPFYPIIFQVLLVLTFALHITMINLVLGSTVVAIWELGRKNPYGLRLAKALGRVITVGLSIAIVLGVAPLLFVQVIYDPYWYTANTMSAFWAMLFLLVVTLAFYSAYGFYLGNRRAAMENASTRWAWVSLVMLLVAGLFIHMLSMEQLNAPLWKGWLVGPDGTVSVAGGEFHGVSLGRLLHFFIGSLAVTGVFLMLYHWYFRQRADYEQEYLVYVSKRGVSIAFWSLFPAIAAGFWWLGTVPQDFHFVANPFFVLGAIAGVCTTAYIGTSFNKPADRAIPAAIALFATIFVMCCAREGLRMDYAGLNGYSIFNYHVNPDWPSTILFFATFVAGLYVLCFPAVAAFKAGRVPKGQVVTLDPELGKKAVQVMVVWFGVVAALGLVISLKNGALF